MPQIIPTTEPFFFVGDSSKPACLLIHGFTGTPKEMRWMGEYLHEQGFTCLGIRLAGHGTIPTDMIRSRYQNWMASVEDGYHLLRGVTGRIFFVGLSMGGVLSLLMSTQLNVSGVVAMSTPYKFPDDPRLKYIKLISKFQPYMPKSNDPPGTGWFDDASWKDHISYPQNPVRSLAELNLLLGEMRDALPKVKAPVLLIHSQNDTYVSPESIDLLYDDLINASDKTKLLVTESGHVVTRDAARRQVFDAALGFIQRVEGQS